MDDSVASIKELAHRLGIEFPEERLQSIAETYRSSLEEAEAVRPEVTEMPEASPFDAAWEGGS